MKSIISGFEPMGGKHCVTNALKQMFHYYNKPISEEMLFGIGSGLAFIYINLADSPMISGRGKVFEFEEKIACRLNMKIKCRSTKIYLNAFNRTKELIDNDNPVLIYVDMPYLEFLNLNENSHFGGHAVVLFGFDDEKGVFYLSDRDNSDYPIRTPEGMISENYHLVEYSQIEKARSSNYRPFPPNNRWLEFDFVNYKPINKETVFESIRDTCNSMLNPPAQLMGVNGIEKFSKEVLKWAKFDEAKLRRAGVTNYFMISADGGTGGGIFRDMYGKFLVEVGNKNNIPELNTCGQQYIEVGVKWNKISALFWELSENGDLNILKKISVLVKQIHNDEVRILTDLSNIVS